MLIISNGGTENAGLENAGLENTGTLFVWVARCNVITVLRLYVRVWKRVVSRPTKPQASEQTGQFYQSHTEAINVG